jgi:hypothetical protein
MVLHYQYGAKDFSSVTYHKPGIDFLVLNYLGCVGLGVLYSWPYPYYFMKIDTPEAPFWYQLSCTTLLITITLQFIKIIVSHTASNGIESKHNQTGMTDVYGWCRYFSMAIVHVVCVLLSLLIAGVKHQIYAHLFSSKAATNAADVRRPLLETST